MYHSPRRQWKRERQLILVIKKTEWLQRGRSRWTKWLLTEKTIVFSSEFGPFGAVLRNEHIHFHKISKRMIYPQDQQESKLVSCVHTMVRGVEGFFEACSQEVNWEELTLLVSFQKKKKNHQKVWLMRRSRKGKNVSFWFMSIDFSQRRLKRPCFKPWRQVQISHSLITDSQIHVRKWCLSTFRSYSWWLRRGEAKQEEAELWDTWWFSLFQRRQRFWAHVCSLKLFLGLIVSIFTEGIQD